MPPWRTLTNNGKSEGKGQRGRSARLEGKKAAATAAASHRTQSTDNDADFLPH